MGDELDTSVDISVDTSSSDFSDSGGFDDSIDVGGLSNDSSDIESLAGAPSDVGSVMDGSAEFSDIADQPSDVIDSLDSSPDIEMLMDEPADLGPVADESPTLTDYQPDVESAADAPLEIKSMMDEPSDVASAMDEVGDVEPYHAIPNSDIPILQEDGTVDTLENIMTASAEAAEVSLDVEPYHATPSSEIPILQADGTVDSLENIMAANADIEEPSLDNPAFENPQSELIGADTAHLLEAIMNDSAELDSDRLEEPSIGMEGGPETEAIVMAERARLQEELAQDISEAAPSQNADFTDPVQGETRNVHQDIEAVDQPAENLEPTDEVADVPQDIDYDAVFSGLDSYDFDGIDVGSDIERLDSSLESFQPETWENLSVDEQKAAMRDLADYVKDVIGFDKPPQIVYYNNPVAGDYGGYSPSTNTLEVNEYMLYDSDEAADTVAHELWHAYQHERALNPQSAKDYQYQYGFDNYIRPDVDFAAYQDQLVEAEARAFAQQFKDRLSTKRRSI